MRPISNGAKMAPYDTNGYLGYMSRNRRPSIKRGKEAFFAMITFFIMILHGIVPWVFDIYFTDYIKGAQDRLNRLSELEE